MEKSCQSLSSFAFQQQFTTDNQCLAYLAAEKWKHGFECPKSGHTHYCSGGIQYSRQCTNCKHSDSPTAGTLFHKVKFQFVKAFYIVYFVSTSKKGITSTELSRKLGRGQKTCWYFKRKVMKAMKSRDNYPLTGKVDVDEFFVGSQEESKKGRGKKSANIKTDKWLGYKPLKSEFKNLEQLFSDSKGGYFPKIHRVIMMFKTWFCETYHSVTDLQAYIDEYTYRFNKHLMKDHIFDNLILRMISNKSYYLD